MLLTFCSISIFFSTIYGWFRNGPFVLFPFWASYSLFHLLGHHNCSSSFVSSNFRPHFKTEWHFAAMRICTLIYRVCTFFLFSLKPIIVSSIFSHQRRYLPATRMGHIDIYWVSFRISFLRKVAWFYKNGYAKQFLQLKLHIKYNNLFLSNFSF